MTYNIYSQKNLWTLRTGPIMFCCFNCCCQNSSPFCTYTPQSLLVRVNGGFRGLMSAKRFDKFVVGYGNTRSMMYARSHLVEACNYLSCVFGVYVFLSASLYFSKRGAYWDRLHRDVVVVVRWLVGRWLVVTRVHCGQTVHPRPIVTMEH